MCILFEALNECPERHKLPTLLESIHNWGIDTLEFATPNLTHDVVMKDSLVGDDIQRHLVKTLEHDVEFQMFSEEEKSMVEITLIWGVHGM